MRTIDIRSLAAFRRFLAEPGATIQLTRHDWVVNKPEIFLPRTVKKLQTNAVQFSNGSWLDWRSGVKSWRFDGGTVTVELDPNTHAVMVYNLMYTE